MINLLWLIIAVGIVWLIVETVLAESRHWQRKHDPEVEQ